MCPSSKTIKDKKSSSSSSKEKVGGKYLYCVIKESKPRKFDILGQAPLEVSPVRDYKGNKKEQREQISNGVSEAKEKHKANKPLTGQEGKEIYTINQPPHQKNFGGGGKGDLAIVVSDTSKQDFSFVREHLTCHQRVIEEVMKEGYDVLPVRFGTVAKSAKDIKEKILKSKRKELLETFPIVEGRIELGLRAFWKDMLSIFQEIVVENKTIQRAKNQAQRNPNQFKVAGVGELVQKALNTKREKEAQKILSVLRKLAVDFKERELLRHREPLKDSMILSSAFLVSKENEKEFDKRVQALIKEYDERIKFIYVGPIPAFNFVELKLKI